MSYGFQTFTQSNYVQVDADYSNYAIIEEGSSNNVYDLMWKCSDQRLVMVQIPKGTSIGNLPDPYNPDMSSLQWFSYRVYQQVKHFALAGSYGVEVFNGAGQRVFDSNRKTMKISYLSQFYPYIPLLSANYFPILTTPNVGYHPWLNINVFSLWLMAAFTIETFGVIATQNWDNSISIYAGIVGYDYYDNPYETYNYRTIMLGD